MGKCSAQTGFLQHYQDALLPTPKVRHYIIRENKGIVKTSWAQIDLKDQPHGRKPPLASMPKSNYLGILCGFRLSTLPIHPKVNFKQAWVSKTLNADWGGVLKTQLGQLEMNHLEHIQEEMSSQTIAIQPHGSIFSISIWSLQPELNFIDLQLRRPGELSCSSIINRLM